MSLTESHSAEKDGRQALAAAVGKAPACPPLLAASAPSSPQTGQGCWAAGRLGPGMQEVSSHRDQICDFR